MSVEGVWKVEMLGPYGWETISTAFLKDGRYLAAGADHYTSGSYKEKDDTFKVKALLTQHGKARTIFGGKKKHVDLCVEGRIKKSGKISAVAHPCDDAKFTVRLRLIQLDHAFD